MTTGWTIGQLAKSAGVHVQTVRYYEKRKLLSPSRRRPSGYRVYDEGAVKRLRFIKNAQALGFTLQEIHELLTLKATSAARCGDVQRKAQGKLEEVSAKIRSLRALTRALQELIRTSCVGQQAEQCPILACLENERAVSGRSRQNGRGERTPKSL